MSDDLETECMNELFDNEELPYYHWRPVAECDIDGNKIRDYTKKEQIEWIKKQLKKDR